jgi:hypothetical protein
MISKADIERQKNCASQCLEKDYKWSSSDKGLIITERYGSANRYKARVQITS